MNGDIPISLWGQLDISSRPYNAPELRDEGRPLFAESDYDLRAPTEDEIERSGLMRHPALVFVKLSRIEGGETRALTFRVEHYHVEAINAASDDWLETAWDALVKLGFPVNQEQHA